MRLKNINEIKKFLKDKNYTDENIKSFINFIEPLYDFYDFMEKEHGKPYDVVEEETNKYSEDVLLNYLKNIKNEESVIEYIKKIPSMIMKKYAEKYDYPNVEKIEAALFKYSEFILVNNLKQKT